MKILLITTGGTIGSVVKNNVVNTNSTDTALIVKEYKKRYNDNDCEFEVVSAVNILSENISKNVWEKLINMLVSTDMTRYDGVIITHGSDTLAYTASLVGLILENAKIPVCIVASNKPIEEKQSNGVDNFRCAVDIIKSGCTGVFVPYRNSDGIIYVHSATDIMESDVMSDDFYSAGDVYAVYDDGKPIHGNDQAVIQTIPPKFFTSDAPVVLSKDVLQISQYPTIDYSAYCVDNIKAVMIRLYHSGTACVDGDYNNTVFSLIDKCENKGVQVYFCSAKKSKNEYDSLHKLLSHGANVLYDIAPPCAYVKLLLACNQNKVTIKEFMEY